MSFCELVNVNSGNLIGEFDSEQDALRDVWAVVQRRGRGNLAGIALFEEDDHGHTMLIAEGSELANLAERAVGVVAA